MPGETGFAIFLFVVAALTFAVYWATKDGAIKTGAKVTSIVAALAALVFLVLACFTVVSTRNIGVTTTFGRPSGTLSNGLHLKAPWQNVTELDGAIQIDNHTGDHASTVRLGNNSTARTDTSIRWRMAPAAADELFLDYRTFDNIRDNLVTRELNAALNEVFSKFDPLSPQFSDGANLEQMSNQVADILRKKVGQQIEVLNVIVPIVRYDDATQDRINALNVEKANTRVAEQRAKTAQAEAEANRILADSVSRDPNVLVSKCLDAVKETKTSPLGCWPGGAAMPTVPVKSP
ncbi:SPFH domain-containing protein [Mycobacterium sp. CBMA271]|uniref:SPFH domain-containing protein n=1 Tax=unclassified Mycobacteroides TaxID=2618759 RepID=UPI0012DE9450|nr:MULTISPECIES: SPFH domain-containing protein [unclassified Mycobacteroides]MUM17846.1 hypothetical protein [Mycobacteroides sp. CBMA 326]MUM20417.1 SPFH domain-containing protein [Mycobacteroides sp. CBMA 271]